MVRSWVAALALVACTGSPAEVPVADETDQAEMPVADGAAKDPAPASAEPVQDTDDAVAEGVGDTDDAEGSGEATEAPEAPEEAVVDEAPSKPEPAVTKPVAEDPPTEVVDATEPEPPEEPDAAVDEPAEEPEPEPAGPVRYTLSPSKSFVGVIVYYDRSALVGGHDHVLVSNRFTGTVDWTSGDPSKCSIQVTVPTSSLRVDPPGSRKRVGIEGETPEKDKPKILDNALGKSQLDAKNHPNLSFASTSCTASGKRVQVTGKLTLRGKAKTISIPMTIKEDGSTFSASGRVNVTHADFGFKPFTAALGALRNDEKLTFRLSFKGDAS